MARPHQIFDHISGQQPAHRAAATEMLTGFPEARMTAFAVQNIPEPPADDDVPDEWLRVLGGQA
jgi:hypothetical protein